MPDAMNRYAGVYAAMPTPLTPDRQVDAAGIARVVDYLLGAGVDGLSILGSTGEGPALSSEQRVAALEATVAAADGRGIVFTGASGTIVDQVIADLRVMDGRGAAAALVPPPFYYALPTSGVVAFYERLADASPVPILLYNIPERTKVTIPLDAVARLATHPNIVGIKDSSGDFGYFTRLTRLAARTKPFTVLTGSDSLLAASLFVGGHGLIGAGVNVLPEVAVALYQAFRAGNHAEAIVFQYRLSDAVDACRIGTFPAAYKAQLVLKGLCGPSMTLPIPPLGDDDLAVLRTALEGLGALAVGV